jgi:hypothetical protein
MNTTTTKINLSDEQRSQIRWASTKTGYVLRTHHARGPRGGNYRDQLVFMGVTETGALKAAAKFLDRHWKPVIVDAELYLVDHLGNVQDTTEYVDLLHFVEDYRVAA